MVSSSLRFGIPPGSKGIWDFTGWGENTHIHHACKPTLRGEGFGTKSLNHTNVASVKMKKASPSGLVCVHLCRAASPALCNGWLLLLKGKANSQKNQSCESGGRTDQHLTLAAATGLFAGKVSTHTAAEPCPHCFCSCQFCSCGQEVSLASLYLFFSDDFSFAVPPTKLKPMM